VISESGIPIAKGRAMDISLTGARIETDAAMVMGTRVDLRFDVREGGRSFQVAGHVRWTAGPMAGIALVGVTDDQAGRLTSLLESAGA
jgi:hypothetical protein